MEVISNILCALSFLLTVIVFLKVKDIKKILFLSFLANFLIAVSYLLVKALNGAVVCFIGAWMSIINCIFRLKNQKIPKWLTAIYLAVITGANLFVSEGISIPTLLVIAAGIAYVLSVGQKNDKMYRFWSMINLTGWVIYDIMVMAWGPLVQHALLLASNIAGLVSVVINSNVQKNNSEESSSCV